MSKKAVGREESFQNGVGVPDSDYVPEEDGEQNSDLKRKNVRGTTGDLAKFLRTEQDHVRISDPPSPHSLHPEQQLLSNAASLYSLTTDITGTTGIVLENNGEKLSYLTCSLILKVLVYLLAMR